MDEMLRRVVLVGEANKAQLPSMTRSRPQSPSPRPAPGPVPGAVPPPWWQPWEEQDGAAREVQPRAGAAAGRS